MHDLKECLITCGYRGHCVNEHYLQWALRTGACSQYFLELIYWLEQELGIVNSSTQVRENINRLFTMLRKSILMKPSYGSEAAINPREFRLQTLKVLVRQLQLRKNPERSLHVNASPQRGNDYPKNNHLKITLNMEKRSKLGDWNERLVRFDSNLLNENI